MQARFLRYSKERALLTPTVPYSRQNGTPCTQNGALLYGRLCPACFPPSTNSNGVSTLARGYTGLVLFGCTIARIACLHPCPFWLLSKMGGASITRGEKKLKFHVPMIGVRSLCKCVRSTFIIRVNTACFSFSHEWRVMCGNCHFQMALHAPDMLPCDQTSWRC